MKKNYTHISMILDRSGSMTSTWNDVVGGYKSMVQENKATPGDCTFTLAAFDHEYELVEDFTNIQNVNDGLTIKPRGSTALLDAIGRTVVSVGEKLAKLKESERPEKVIVVVNTDGQENASTEFKRDEIKTLIEEQTSKYNWQFQFIGASLDSVKDAQSWGFQAANTSVYDTKNSGDTFTLLGSKMAAMRCASTPDAYAKAAQFSDEDKAILNASKI
jgi:uncharacterized protein YegL